MSDETPAERVSRFREHTNTTSSIRPPPDELWKEVGIESLLDKFHDENDSTPAVRKASHPRQIMSPTAPAQPWTAAARKGSDAAATVATAEGTFGRFSRVFANVFGGVLGKRKAGHTDAEPSVGASVEQARLDERKRQAEEAYHMAKEQGLLPAPKLFVRPGMAPRAWSAGGSLDAHSPADDADSTQTRPRAPGPPHPAHPRQHRPLALQEGPQQAEEALEARLQPRGQARLGQEGAPVGAGERVLPRRPSLAPAPLPRPHPRTSEPHAQHTAPLQRRRNAPDAIRCLRRGRECKSARQPRQEAQIRRPRRQRRQRRPRHGLRTHHDRRRERPRHVRPRARAQARAPRLPRPRAPADHQVRQERRQQAPETHEQPPHPQSKQKQRQRQRPRPRPRRQNHRRQARRPRAPRAHRTPGHPREESSSRLG
ncbi:uncharacterized protein EKO05_0008606 [Ascochyta rabiei]|uniref:uncharacterized protein n=1 Tax=Didymella rabiei TaxID=5454 RepID=UPI002206ECC5|nr:uncharacterized protein EKO05_0008606 [Ascochyta rabiei]UPX18303.1 hypothetical protein EKO05_0008606 [Ascochyta rabiei]